MFAPRPCASIPTTRSCQNPRSCFSWNRLFCVAWGGSRIAGEQLVKRKRAAAAGKGSRRERRTRHNRPGRGRMRARAGRVPGARALNQRRRAPTHALRLPPRRQLGRRARCTRPAGTGRAAHAPEAGPGNGGYCPARVRLLHSRYPLRRITDPPRRERQHRTKGAPRGALSFPASRVQNAPRSHCE